MSNTRMDIFQQTFFHPNWCNEDYLIPALEAPAVSLTKEEV